MQLYPAIDMKNGKCVRLTQGLFDKVKIYGDSPADMAKLWVSQGASFLHLVENLSIVQQMLCLDF